MISVVIPLYNKASSISRAIQSVLRQTYDDYEIIVVNDGSTDDSKNVVEQNNNPQIRLINQSNAGVSAARNRGIVEAKGEFVAFLDADDEWEPNFLTTISCLIKNYPECKIFGTNYTNKFSNGSCLSTVIKGVNFLPKTHGIINNYFEVASMSSPPICSICVAMRKDDILRIGGFPVGIKSGEDLLTWAKLLVEGSLAYSLKPLAIYNLGDGYNYSNLPPRRQDKGDPVGKELKKLLKDNPGTIGLKKYISHWHKMRASVAIRFGECRDTLIESGKALYYNPMNYKVLPFILLSLLPSAIRRKLISMKTAV